MGHRYFVAVFVLIASALSAMAGAADARDSRNLAIVGHINSLWNHTLHAKSKRTSISSWLDTMLAQDKRRYAERMEFGFFDSYVVPPQASSTWNVNGDASGISMLGETGWTHIQLGFNATGQGGDIVFSSDNFAMGITSPPRMPLRPGDSGGTTPPGKSYVEAASDLIAGYETNIQGPKRYWVFSGLPGFDENTFGKWPANTDVAPWKTHVRGDWTAWQSEFVEGLRAANPGLEIDLINCAQIFVDTWDNVVPEMTHTDWFEDLSPHGNPDAYAVYAAIVYSTFFGTQAPDISLVLGRSGVNPIVVENWTAITEYISREVNG